MDVFVHDRRTNQTSRLAASPGRQVVTAPSISASGRIVTWTSADPEDTVRGVFVHDRRRHTTTRIADGYLAEISPDGRSVVYQGPDEWMYLAGLQTSMGQLVSIDSRGRRFRCRHPEAVQGEGACTQSPTVSRGGRFVAFMSLFPRFEFDWTAMYLYDRRNGKTTRLYAGTADPSPQPRLSADGRFVAFRTFAALVPQDTNRKTDVYVAGPLR